MPLRLSSSSSSSSRGNPALLQRDLQRNAFHTKFKQNKKKNEAPIEENDTDASGNLNRRVSYGMASVDLSSEWWKLVQDEKVVVTTTVPASDDNDDNSSEEPAMIGVRYGVRLHPSIPNTFMEFVEPSGNNTAALEMHPKIAAMNTTLLQAAGLKEPNQEGDSSSQQPSSSGITCRFDGPFAAQVQLVRTLRPPPSPGFGSDAANDYRTTSTPPPYDAATDSFVTGPLRLSLRPRVARLSQTALSTEWDVYHNISPADVRGHFLLLPNLDEHLADVNWRGQALVESDCTDLARLTASIRPLGSLLVCFNSVGAGASQNHIHCHLWPAPPVPLLIQHKERQKEQQVQEEETADVTVEEGVEEEEEGEANNSDYDDDDEEEEDHTHDYDNPSVMHGWNCYAASRVSSINDFVDIPKDEEAALVEVSYLDYPCFCVQLSTSSTATSTSPAKTVESLHAVGKALWTVLSCIGDSPHNVCMLNRPSINAVGDENNAAENNNHQQVDDGCVNVDVFVFVRSRERSTNIVPASKAGASEMMGVFHCHNLHQLEELVVAASSSQEQGDQQQQEPPMEQVLEDVSYENRAELWEFIKEALVATTTKSTSS